MTETAVYDRPVVAISKDTQWVWTPVDDILNCGSVDFLWCDLCGTLWCEHNYQEKRSDYDSWSEFVDDIKQHGLRFPLQWDGRELGNGHHRFIALLELGCTHVPTIDYICVCTPDDGSVEFWPRRWTGR